MAYVMDLEEDFGESDIPTTTIRSKADVEGTVANQTTLSTNDIVINKLTQVGWDKLRLKLRIVLIFIAFRFFPICERASPIRRKRRTNWYKWIKKSSKRCAPNKWVRFWFFFIFVISRKKIAGNVYLLRNFLLLIFMSTNASVTSCKEYYWRARSI